MWNEMSWDRMPGTGTEVPTIGEFLAGNPVPHLVPHDMSVTLGVPARARTPSHRHYPACGESPSGTSMRRTYEREKKLISLTLALHTARSYS